MELIKLCVNPFAIYNFVMTTGIRYVEGYIDITKRNVYLKNVSMVLVTADCEKKKATSKIISVIGTYMKCSFIESLIIFFGTILLQRFGYGFIISQWWHAPLYTLLTWPAFRRSVQYNLDYEQNKINSDSKNKDK